MERAASKALALSGYNCFQPVFRERCIEHGRTRWRDRLLLGRYLLIEFVFDFANHYGQLLAVKGLSSLLMADGRPLVALEREVKVLRDLVNDHGHVPVKVKQDRFTKGDKVYTITGPFGEMNGVFDGMKNDRAVVLYQLFGQLTPVEVEQRSLIAA
jgi:transcription antitermination factor NusG